MKTTIILCTLLIVFQGTLKMLYKEDIQPHVEEARKELKSWL